MAQPEYGTVYQHQGMLLQNLHRHYLHIVIRLATLQNLEQKIPTFPDCDNYGISRSLNPNLTSDDIKLNDNALHQQICTHFKVDYLEEMDTIKQTKSCIEQKINGTLLALLLNKIIQTSKGSVTTTGMKGQLQFGSREKRAIPIMAILQAGAAIGGTLIKGINALVDAKRAKPFNHALKMVTANVELTHQRLRTLENRMSMMAKAIIPALDNLKSRIANKSEIPIMAILQAGAAIGGTLIKGINALVDAKRAKPFNNALKMVTANVELTRQRLRTLENRMSMMEKAIIPALDNLKSRIANKSEINFTV